MKSVYIETSIFSYLTARPSANLVAAARQHLTREWWDNCRELFNLYVSPLVEQEAARGDQVAAAKRLEAIRTIPELEITQEIFELTSLLLAKGALPEKAEDDATHVAIAAIHGISYLLTWNCRHIDNAEMKPVIRTVCENFGVKCPEICTPEELMGGINYER